MRKAIKYDALQLADDLVKWPYERYEAAAELRRLHALNAELVEALRACREMVGHADNVAFIDAALAKAKAREASK